MSLYVVDASAGVKWFVPEVDSDAALRLQNPAHQLHVPFLFDVEVANTIWKKLRRGELSSVTANAVVAQLPSVPVLRHADGPLVRAAFELAEKTGRTVYDSLYLALADRLAGKVVTADDRFVHALSATAWAHFIISLRQVLGPIGRNTPCSKTAWTTLLILILSAYALPQQRSASIIQGNAAR